MENSQGEMEMKWKTGEGGVHHSLTTPFGVEKSIENPLPRTGGAAPPLGRKKQDFELQLTPGYPEREKRNFLFCRTGYEGAVRGREPGRGCILWKIRDHRSTSKGERGAKCPPAPNEQISRGTN